MSHALPQVYASDAELAATDNLRDTGKFSEGDYAATQQQQQDYYDQQQQSGSQSYRNTNDFAQSVHQQQQQQQQQTQFHSSYNGSLSQRHVQRPQKGIQPIPKDAQRVWQTINQQGAFQYKGNTFAATMQLHLPSEKPSGHADGPQHLESVNGTLPDAPHRQSWSIQPTFRFFKRSDYDSVPDRWAQKEGLKGRGDSAYRPLSVREQQIINERVERRKANKGAPRTGEW